MFNKIFLALFAISILVMMTFAFLCYTQLQSVGFPPLQIIQNFEYFNSLFYTVLWISSLILLVLANIILWTNKKSWALWLTYAYFSLFIMLNMWWLADSFVAYTKRNDLWNGSFNIGGIFGAFFVIVVGIGVFFDQFIVLRLHNKMFNKPITETETVAIEPSETENSESKE